MFLPHPRVKVSIVGSLRDREVACSASDRQGSNSESCVWRTVSSQSSHHPQEVLLAQFSLYVHKGGLKPDSFHLFTSHSTISHIPVIAIGSLAWIYAAIPQFAISLNLPTVVDVFNARKSRDGSTCRILEIIRDQGNPKPLKSSLARSTYLITSSEPFRLHSRRSEGINSLCVMIPFRLHI